MANPTFSDRRSDKPTVPGYNTYIGARYVPIFDGAWVKTKTYEPLMIVEWQGNSYTSRTYVPANVEITDESYWALTGNYNAQIEAYREEVENVRVKTAELENDINDINMWKGFVIPEQFGAVGDGTTNDRDAIQKAVSSGHNVAFSPGKTYFVDGSVNVSSSINIQGGGAVIECSPKSITSSVFNVKAEGVYVNNLSFHSENTYPFHHWNNESYSVLSSNIEAFYVSNGNFTAENITTENLKSAVYLDDTRTNIIENIKLSNIKSFSSYFPIFINQASGVFIDNIDISLADNAPNICHCIYCSVKSKDVYVNNFNVTANSPNTSPFLSVHPSGLTARDNDLTNIHFSNGTINGSGALAFDTTNCGMVYFDNITVLASVASIISVSNNSNSIIKNSDLVTNGGPILRCLFGASNSHAVFDGCHITVTNARNMITDFHTLRFYNCKLDTTYNSENGWTIVNSFNPTDHPEFNNFTLEFDNVTVSNFYSIGGQFFIYNAGDLVGNNLTVYNGGSGGAAFISLGSQGDLKMRMSNVTAGGFSTLSGGSGTIATRNYNVKVYAIE